MIELRGTLELGDVVELPDDAEGLLPHAASPSTHPATSPAATQDLIFNKGLLPVTPSIMAYQESSTAD
jgi:hypothetical protein